MNYKPEGLAEIILKERYASYKEETWEEACLRVATAVARAEENGKFVVWKDRFYDLLVDGKFCPGGRIWYGSGRPKQQLLNCFVLPAEDSREGWGKVVSDMIVVSGTGGGVGINGSSIRYRGAPIRGTGGRATGAVSLFEVIDSAGEVIKAGGGRRTALMLCLDMIHPDIVEFIDKKFTKIKRNASDVKEIEKFIKEEFGLYALPKEMLTALMTLSTRQDDEEDANKEWQDFIQGLSDLFLQQNLSNANVSIVFSTDPEEFFKKVKNNEDWEFKWHEEVISTINARDLWNKIISNFLEGGEPGILNGFLANKMSNIYYYEPLISTNPSLRGDSLVLTNKGIFSIKDLENQKIKVMNVYGEFQDAICFKSGKNKQLIKLKLQNGIEIFCTKEHKWPILVEGGIDKKSVLELKHNDKLPIPINHNKAAINNEHCKFSKQDGFILGWNLGDGWITYHKRNKTLQYGFIFSKEDEENNIAYFIESKINSLTKRKVNLRENKGCKELVCTDNNVIDYFEKMGASHKSNGIPKSVWRGNNDFIMGFIDGLFSSDGHIDDKRNRIVLVSSHENLVNDIKNLLSFYGISCSIKKSESASKFPKYNSDKIYIRYDLTISSFYAKRFAEIFKLSNEKKQINLQKFLDLQPTRKCGSIDGYVNVDSVEETDLYEDVYDITVNDDTHTFIVNGVTTGNCGEIWLERYGCCDLGALVLSRFLNEDRTDYDWEALADAVTAGVRFLDNVLTVNNYPLPEIAQNCQELRRIGLGVMALHDSLLMMGIKYSSEEGLKKIDQLFNFIKNKSYEASTYLAVEKGVFPKYEKDKFLKSGFVKTLKKSIRARIKEYGIRNCALLTIAPTGTTGMLMGMVSTGIEPIFGPAWNRIFYSNNSDSGKKQELVFHPLFLEMFKEGKDLKHFESSYDISPEDHMKVQAICQKHIDNAVSKTINIPAKGYSLEEFSEALMEYIPKLKGLTVYKAGSRGDEPLQALSIEEALQALVDNKDAKGEVDAEQMLTQDCPNGVCQI